MNALEGLSLPTHARVYLNDLISQSRLSPLSAASPGLTALEKLLRAAQPLSRAQATALRIDAGFAQQKAGLDHIPSNDFSLYDQMLDTIAMLGAVPPRFGHAGGPVPLDLYFSMARGRADQPAMEMTKWFDTNYHYIVPELTADIEFRLSGSKALEEYQEARFLGIATRPVLIGPVTFLKLAKMRDGSERWALLPRLLGVYRAVLASLAQAGAEWVQIDEPVLVTDLDETARTALKQAYAVLAAAPVKIMLATYFGAVGDNLLLAGCRSRRACRSGARAAQLTRWQGLAPERCCRWA